MKFFDRLPRALGFTAGLLLAAAPSHAYITSAILEYCADDIAAFHLNGSVLLEKSPFCPFDFTVLSTSDGTLPLELFKENEENLLAAENLDTRGGSMFLAYRLTVHHSDGDPVVVYSDPGATKFLHLKRTERNPPGWTQVNFDDSGWGQAKGIRLKLPYTASPDLLDPRIDGIFGTGAYVPYLVHKISAQANGGDHNLFRSRFRFPNNPSKVKIAAVPETAKYGEAIAVRLYPGPDTTEFSNFNILAWVPPSLKIFQTSPGARYDRNLGRLHWAQSSRDLELGFVKMGVQEVVSSGGWTAVNKMLGREKKGKVREQLNVPDAIFNDGAVISHGGTAWFKMELPKLDTRRGVPVIQGIIFHNQMKMGGFNNKDRDEVDKVYFNYSVDGKKKGFLKGRGVDVARTSYNTYWFDGYYDATEDRDWTWADLQNLMVSYRGQQVATRDRNMMASVVATVRYYYPAKVAPWFKAQVVGPELRNDCKPLALKTGLFRHGTKSMSTDEIELVLGNCRPTPIPTPTFTPVPVERIVLKPTPTPIPANIPGYNIKLRNLTANPNPFDYGGTFISFNIKRSATVQVVIYDLDTRKAVRRIEGKEFRAGSQQIFFNSLDSEGKRLKPGTYLFELTASAKGESTEVLSSEFRVVKKKPKR